MQLGLERVARVVAGLKLPALPVTITVAGTNGKGSTCAMLESILLAAAYRVGCYTSPHLYTFKERIRIDGAQIDDATLDACFAQVVQAPHSGELTEFELDTLAAVVAFQRQALDVVILEVGLGGRLDAVNAFEPHCSIVVSVDLDHMDFLGATRELIGFEKAGIFRGGKPAIVADADPPKSLVEHARAIGAELYLIDRDFGFVPGEAQWQFWDWRGKRDGLPLPALRGAYQLGNASAVLAAFDALRDQLPVDMGAIRRGLVQVQLPGRFQVIPGQPSVILDVAHNPHAAARLAENLQRVDRRGRRIAVFGMLKDKDIAGVIAAVAPQIDEWLVAPLPGMRGADLARLAQAFDATGVTSSIGTFQNVASALAHAREHARPDDKIVVFGSFLTVADALHALDSNH